MTPFISDEPWNVIEHRARGIAFSINSGRGKYKTEDMVYASTGNPMVDRTVIEVARQAHRIYQTYPPAFHESLPMFYQAGYSRLAEHVGRRYDDTQPYILQILLNSDHFAPVDLSTEHDSNTPVYAPAVHGILLWMADHDAAIPLLDLVQPLVRAYTDDIYPLPGQQQQQDTSSAYHSVVTVQRWLQLAILLSLHHAALHIEHDPDMPFAWREPFLSEHMIQLLKPSPAMDRLFDLAEQDVENEALEHIDEDI